MENSNITNLFNMVDKEVVQRIQDFLASTLDFAFLCVYHDVHLTKPSGESDFCKKINATCPGLCDECHSKLADLALYENRTVIKECHLGMMQFAIPISINGKYMLSVLGGQVLVEPVNEDKFVNLAKKLGINEKEFYTELNQVKVIPYEKLESLTELLKIMANIIAAISYANFQLAEKGIEYQIPINSALKDWYEESYCREDEQLSAREREVLKLVLVGKTNNEIAEELFISVHTAKSHVSSILEKFKVDDRVQLAVKTVREGLL